MLSDEELSEFMMYFKMSITIIRNPSAGLVLIGWGSGIFECAMQTTAGLSMYGIIRCILKQHNMLTEIEANGSCSLYYNKDNWPQVVHKIKGHKNFSQRWI